MHRELRVAGYKRYINNMGTVSHATMLAEDLIPAFIDCLKDQKPNHHRKLIREIESRMYADNCPTCGQWHDPEFDGDCREDSERYASYFDSESAQYDLNESLFDALNEYCPPYFYFGSHPGDGSDYGFWLDENWEDSSDGIKVSDSSEIPKGYTGEVAIVSDHGNVSLYRCSRGKLYLIWAIV
jgi:hypothetical protein